jgi:preprotein translocase subunit SecA
VRDAIDKVDMSEGAKFLEGDYGTRSAVSWIQGKFGIPLDASEVRNLDAAQFTRKVRELVDQLYNQKEIEYPVLKILGDRIQRDPSGQKLVDREGIAKQGRDRFQASFTEDQFRTMASEDIRAELLRASEDWQQRAIYAVNATREQLASLPATLTNPDGSVNEAFDKFYQWLRNEHLVVLPTAEELAHLDREKLERQVMMGVEMRYRFEIRHMERILVLEILDEAWKNHLLAMDHLRSSVSLRGYAQVDPKVEYKREGMRMFDQLWNNVGERVTDLVFKVEQIDESVLIQNYDEGQERKDDATGAGLEGAVATASQNGQADADAKIEPIRNNSPKVGRNDPCPCGSGKKFKHCHGKPGMAAI